RKRYTQYVKELINMYNTVVEDYLQNAKQWLLISCYIGQRISDFMNFSQSQITSIEGNKCLTFIQQKTGKKITLPLHKEVLDIEFILTFFLLKEKGCRTLCCKT